MASMTDPTDALVSFQQALLDGEVRLQHAELDPDLFVFQDKPSPDLVRFTYVRLDGKTVKVFVNAMRATFIDGLPCFQLGVAVPVKYRNKGYAKSTLAGAIAEMENGFKRAGFPDAWVVADRRRIAPGILASDREGWRTVIDGIGKKVELIANKKRGPARDDALEFYKGAMASFEGFKDAYRNNVMHARKSYNSTEALALMHHVRDFMNRLGSKIDEQAKKQIKWAIRP